MPIDLTSLLKEWGVTVGLLSVVATGLLMLFALSMREFFYWFLKLSKIVKNQELILQRLSHLETLIEKQNTETSSNTEPLKPGTPLNKNSASGGGVKETDKPSAQFPIHGKLADNSTQTFQLLN